MMPEHITRIAVDASSSSWIYWVGVAASAAVGGVWKLVVVPIKKRLCALEKLPPVSVATCDRHLADTQVLREEIYAHIENIHKEQMRIAKRLYFIAGRINGGSVPHDF